MRSPNIVAWNSERLRPSPCSPECEPRYSLTIANASSAIARIVRAPDGSFMLRIGRTWRQPTEACAYHVPSVPYRANSRVSRSVNSARCGSGTAQSSMNDTGFPSPFIDIMMLRPALRTAVISAWDAASGSLTTEPG